MKAALAGGTGFIGSLLIKLLEVDSEIDRVTIVSRRPLSLPQKFETHVGDLASWTADGPIDVAFCALGTTIRTARSKEAFYTVDHNMVLEFARKTKAAGVRTFVLVSSVGADAKSGNFYLRVKGEIERDLEELGFRSLIILRPSMLMGDRKEFRLGELIGKGVMTVFNPFMFGSMRKYRGIDGTAVAKAMLRLSKEDLPGVHVLESDKLEAFS